jgi:hypothetical protein
MEKKSKFIKGPLKAEVVASLIKGATPSTLHTYLVLLYVKGLRKSNKFTLKYSQAKDLGVEPRSLWNGLTALQKRGIIVVVRSPGVRPYVELL